MEKVLGKRKRSATEFAWWEHIEECENENENENQNKTVSIGEMKSNQDNRDSVIEPPIHVNNGRK
jgi:hypothetical protein